jgi:uncharacterized protein YraI
MRRYALSLAAAVLATAAVPSVAAAADAEVVTDVNMRAGPASSFPVVEVVPDDANVNVHGCVRGYSWCDVTWRGARGWIYADYLRFFYAERYVPVVEYATIVDVPVITFSVDTYWDRYYTRRPWYHRRAYWHDRWRARRDDRLEERADRRRDRREDRAERREDRREARQDLRRERRVDRRDARVERRRENRAEQRERRREARIDRRRDDRAERRQLRQERSSQRMERPGAERGGQFRERGGGGGGRGDGDRGRRG